jgi:hypothetical protein
MSAVDRICVRHASIHNAVRCVTVGHNVHHKRPKHRTKESARIGTSEKVVRGGLHGE